MSLKTFVIANPHAGNGQVKKDWEQIERRLRTRLPEFDYAFTEGPNHASLLSREAVREGWEMIVAIGGDGTTNEVVNGFFEKPEPNQFEIDDGWIVDTGEPLVPINPNIVLGTIPMGTGGDFRRSIGVMGDLHETIDRLGGEDTRDCDVGHVSFVSHKGKVTTRFFINIASVGLSGAVDAQANKTWKGLGGKASFGLASAVAWLTYKNQEMVVRLDDVEEIKDKFQSVICANGQYFGGGMWIAPGAELDDGKFQVVFMGDLNRAASLKAGSKLYAGRHFELDKIFRRRASRVAIKGVESKRGLIDCDGEQPGTLPALFQISPSQIRIKI